MPLQTGDIRFARSAVMADVDSGGGPPTSQLIPDGASNAIVPDMSEDALTGGLVEIRQIHGVLRNTDTDALLGANIIVAEPPEDDNVAITLIKSPGTFARRPDLVKLIEASSTPGAEFSGFLLEAHVQGQRSLNIAQRPGMTPPAVNTALVLVQNEGQLNEVSQYVRIRRVTVSTQAFTVLVANEYLDLQMQVSVCELFAPLAHDFPGSAPNRLYTRETNKTKMRVVNVTDAGTFYSAQRLQEPVQPNDMQVKVQSPWVQLVPNTRTETPLLNQRPAGERLVTLSDSMGSLQVNAAAHTARVAVTPANQGFAYVFKLVPPPAPNSVSVSYVALDEWQTVIDNGAGELGDGPGSGTVLYSTGDLALTAAALPDVNTFILVSWASTAPFVNAVPGPAVQVAGWVPEFELSFPPGSTVSGATVEWVSGGVARSAVADAAGVLSGGATGLLVGALGTALVRPQAMPDAGSSFTINLASRPTVSDAFADVTVDAGGFAALTLSQEPVPGTVGIRWSTARTVSRSSGVDLSGSSSWTYTPVGRQRGKYQRSTQSTSTDREVVAHAVQDDGAGGFGDLGTVNYGARAVSFRAVVQGASTQGYRSDQESASAFFGAGSLVAGRN